MTDEFQLSNQANRQLDEVRSLVLRFQSLENELRDTFVNIEQQHRHAIAQYQQEINRLGSNNYGSPLPQQRQSKAKAPATAYQAPGALFKSQTMRIGSSSMSKKPMKRRFSHQKMDNVPPPPTLPPPENNALLQSTTTQPSFPSYTNSINAPKNQFNYIQQTTNHSLMNGNNSHEQSVSHNDVFQNKNIHKYQDSNRQNSSSVSTKNKPLATAHDLIRKQVSNGNKNKSNGRKKQIKKQKKKEIDMPQGISERDFYKKYWIEAGKIGDGAFSRVRKITRKSDKQVFALKMIKKKGKSDADIAALQQEIVILLKCDHPNIVRLTDFCDTAKRIYMVVEFCDGGDVFERVIQYKKFTEKAAIHVVTQVSTGLIHIHSKSFVHRDLKPDNLMYVTKDLNSDIKIIDFGLAGDCSGGNKCSTPCGTAHYAAPEVLSAQTYDMSADLWSLGVIIYTLLCGFPPFFDASNNMKNLYHLIKKGSYSFPSPFWDEITAEAKDLISKLLVKDPQKRLTATQVLKHAWVVNVASEKELGQSYTQQMTHWHSMRQDTEFDIGTDEETNDDKQPVNLFYSKVS